MRNPFPSRAELRSNSRPLLMCLVSGLFGGLIFHQNALGLLGWVALVPYFMAVPRLHGKMLAWGTMLFGFVWYYLGLFWLHTLVVFSWLVPLGVVVGVIYISLYFLLFAYPAAWCSRNLKPALQPWAIAACWTAVEYLRGFTDMAFPWNLLGHSQVPFNEFMLPLAAISSTSLITFIMALANSSIAAIVVSVPELRAALIRRYVILFVAAFLLIYGLQPVRESNQGSSGLNVAVVQPGFDQLERWNAMMGTPGQSDTEWAAQYQKTEAQMEMQIDRLVREAGKSQPALVVLPESPFLLDRFPYQVNLQQGLWNLAKDTSATLFLGADNLIDRQSYSKLSAAGQRFLAKEEKPAVLEIRKPQLRVNDAGTTEILPDSEPLLSLVSAWQITPENGLEPVVYNKMQLVPFGENVPFIGGIDWLVNALDAGGIAGRFRPGMENTIFEVDGHRYGAVICFESTFSYLTRHLARADVDFLCVLTNDSWYDPHYAMEQGGFWGTLFKMPGVHQLAAAGPRQHFIHSLLRSLETNLPVLRSANTGISAILENGVPVKEMAYGQAGVLNATIRTGNKPLTLFTRYGDWFSLVCLGVWSVIVASAVWHGRRFFSS